jgi:hypothetical protein
MIYEFSWFMNSPMYELSWFIMNSSNLDNPKLRQN